MTIDVRNAPLIQNLHQVSVPLYRLWREKLDYKQAVAEGEIWVGAALKLSLTAALFFTYQKVLPQKSTLVSLCVVVISTVIHPVASLNALLTTSLFQSIKAWKQISLNRAQRQAIFTEALVKGRFVPGALQQFTEASRKVGVFFQKLCKWQLIFIPTTAISLWKDSLKTRISSTTGVAITTLDKVIEYSQWLDHVIAKQSKAAAPHFVAYFGYTK